MKQITLDIKPVDPRPIIYLKNFFEIDAMLDTGAVIPVWVEEEDTLQSVGGIKERENFNFSGFGGEVYGTLYRIPIFTLSELTFPYLPIVAARMNLPCHLILSATMFSRLIYEIDDVHHKLNISVPVNESTTRNITVRDVNGRVRVVCSNARS